MILAFPIILLGQPFSLDTTFQPDYPFFSYGNKANTGNVIDLLEEPDGFIMVAGYFKEWPQIKGSNVIRLKGNGDRDLTWKPSFWITEGAYYIKKADGYYFFNSGNFGIRKTDYYGNFQYIDLGANIPLDSLFAGYPFKPYIFPDQSMLVGGDGSKYPSAQNFQRRLYFMRIKPNGYTDTSFYHNTNYDVEEVIRYDSTRLLLYGNQLAYYDSIPINKLCLIDTAGNLDTSFYAGSFTSGSPGPKYVQPDGKIIVGGIFTVSDYPDTLNVIRLNPNGSIDTTFNNTNSALGNQSTVHAVCPTTDGGLLIGGSFTTYQGYPRNRIVKTDGDGFLDLQYLYGEGIDSAKNNVNFGGEVRQIVYAQNDKYYIMGHFAKYNGEVVKPLIRILGLSHTVGIEEEADQATLSVFPNPTADYTTFNWSLGEFRGKAILRIYDLSGRQVVNQSVNAFEGHWIWETHDVSNGIYLYELRTETQALLGQGKIVVKH